MAPMQRSFHVWQHTTPTVQVLMPALTTHNAHQMHAPTISCMHTLASYSARSEVYSPHVTPTTQVLGNRMRARNTQLMHALKTSRMHTLAPYSARATTYAPSPHPLRAMK